MYNPYSTEAHNSPQFIEWQFRRATEAVYGKPVPLAEYQGNRTPLPPPVQGSYLRAMNIAACAAWILLVTNLLIGAMHWRVQRYIPGAENLVSGLFFAVLIAFLFVFRGLGDVQGFLVSAALFRLVPLLPANAIAAAIVGLVPSVVLCWTAARLFRGVDPPPIAMTVRER